jgi:hypothetical protein
MSLKLYFHPLASFCHKGAVPEVSGGETLVSLNL